MGFLDKLIAAGGVVALGVAARNALETRRRRACPLHFDEGLSRFEFIELARAIAKRAPRVKYVVVSDMTVTLHVGSISGLSTWKAEVDFNDYGHLTGTYWLNAENTDSLVPEHFANAMKAQIRQRVGTPRLLCRPEARSPSRWPGPRPELNHREDA